MLTEDKAENSIVLIIGVVVGLGVLLILLIVIVVAVCIYKQRKRKRLIEDNHYDNDQVEMSSAAAKPHGRPVQRSVVHTSTPPPGFKRYLV